MIETDVITDGPPEKGTLVVAVGAASGSKRDFSDAARRLDERTDGLIAKALEIKGLKHGKSLDLLLPRGTELDRLVVLALGPGGESGGGDEDDGDSAEAPQSLEFERAGAALGARLSGLSVKQATIAPLDGLPLGGVGPGEAAVRLLQGINLKSYKFRKYKTPDADSASKLERVDLCANEPEAVRHSLAAARAEAEAVARARDLVSEPANVLYPKAFAERAKELESLGVEVTLLDKARLTELKMGALLGVAQGSERDPYIAVMRWNGGAKGAAPVALVGKGVCFDTGGISIKPSAGMEQMKWDMAGAGAVVGAMHAIAARKANANVVGVIALVENMPDGKAQRPGDVVTTMSGKTVEVINTDAEGRLILADAITYTQREFKPSALVDLATLTGAVIVALGHERAGLFANDDELARQLSEAGESCGELLWRLPLGGGYDKHVRSNIADMKNTGQGREAGATAGATFIKRFVEEVPWAHLDIAGTAWANSDKPLSPKGATGFGVRLLDRWVKANFEGAASGNA